MWNEVHMKKSFGKIDICLMEPHDLNVLIYESKPPYPVPNEGASLLSTWQKHRGKLPGFQTGGSI